MNDREHDPDPPTAERLAVEQALWESRRVLQSARATTQVLGAELERMRKEMDAARESIRLSPPLGVLDLSG